ncbi:MAG TPA: hypothetical protein VNA25_10740 [Phycisphaerae bacterium]|nr:hypothetical protein [Phycisphaerae bacterium]
MAKDRYQSQEAPRFSRRWWLDAGKTFLQVAVVTVLIWVYADLEKTEKEKFDVKLVLHTGASGDLALLDEVNMSQRELEVSFSAEGSRGGLNALRGRLADRASVISFDLSAAFGPGKHDVQIAEILARTDLISKAGLTVHGASPPMVVIELDRTKYVPDVEVRFNYTGGTVAEAKVSPPKMGLRIAAGVLQDITAGGGKLVLETEPVNLQAVDPGKPIIATIVPFVLGVPVRPEKPAVEVQVTLSRLPGEKTLAIPVGLRVPQSWSEDDTWLRFVLKRKDPLDWRKQIIFRGAKKDIDRLRAEDVDAYVVLTDNDKVPTESWLTRDVQIRLPRDMQIQAVGEKLSVSFRLEPRPAPTPP